MNVKTIFRSNLKGTAITRQVKRAERTLKNQRIKNMCASVIKAGIATAATGWICSKIDMGFHPEAVYPGVLAYMMTCDNEKLDSAITNCRNLKASDEYQKVLERAEKFKQARKDCYAS